MKALETLGIIEVRAGLGLYVKDFSFSTVLGHLAYGLMFNSRPLVEILEARTYLEIGVAHRVVASATPAQLRELEASLGAMSDAAREGRYSRKEDEHFHDVLFQEVKNDIVHSLLEMFWEVLNVSVQHAGVRPDPIDPMKAYLSHELIVAELKRGDADGFSKAVLDHYAGLLHRLGGSTAEWLDANRFLAETSTDRPAMT